MADQNWATYDHGNFPVVKIKLSKSIRDNEDFNNFLNGWLKCYDNKKHFIMIFDTTDVGFVNMKYAFKMVSFIDELKKINNGLLLKSYIIYDSFYVRMLLKLIFSLKKPIAPVIIHKKTDNKPLEEMAVSELNNFTQRQKAGPTLSLD